ncbi:MAG: HEAT repeat domain-containing protein [Deltaproteobacteria bacterium]|nr:HEAT repeat domain-containing protein [Deltaproteobacteria bacterium]
MRWAGAGLALLLVAGCQGQHDRLLKEFEAPGRPELRAGALARLAEMGHEEDFHLFLRATRDPSALVRRSAVLGLGLSGDSKAIDTLGELLADPDYDVEAEAARGLARFNTDKSRAYLLSSYGRRDGPARAAIAVALGPEGLKDAIRHEAKLLWERHQKALEAGGPAERVGAAEEIGRSGRGEAVERLLPMLGDDSVLLAAGAARGLGAARDRRAVAPLMGVLKENHPVLREAAAEALGLLGDASAVQALEKLALEGGSGSAAAVNAIGLLASAPEGRASLCKLTAEGNRDVAALAARLARARQSCAPEPIVSRLSKGGVDAQAALAALEGLGGGVGVDRVVGLLESQDRSLKLAAAHTLLSLEGASDVAGAKVVKVLEVEVERVTSATQKWVKEPLPAAAPPKAPGAGDDQDRVRKLDDMMAKVDALKAARAEALGVKLIDREAAKGPLDVVDDVGEGEEELLLPLARAAGKLKAPGSQAVLEKLIQMARPSVRAASCEALAMLATPDALAVVVRCLDDAEKAVLRATARGLKVAGTAGQQMLVGALKRRTSERWELVRALGELKVREAAPAISQLLSVGGAESVEAAVALGKVGDPGFADELAAQLEEPTHPARLDVIEALGQLGVARVSPTLTRELLNERPEVRAVAARALGKLDRKGAGPTLEALRFDYYAEVRRAVEEALGAPPPNLQGAR